MIVLVLFASLAMVGLSNRSAVHPGFVQMLMNSELENLECREGEPPTSVLDAPSPARTTGFSVAGHFHCYRPLFTAQERNPYIDHALDGEATRAKRVAQSLTRQLQSRTGQELIGVRIEGVTEAGLREDISALYRVELNAALGAGRVRRGGEAQPGQPVLVIHVNRVDVVELMSSARLLSVDQKGVEAWLEI